MAIPRVKPGNHPAFLSYGFRPFFLAGALYGALAIAFWLPLLYGRVETQSVLAPVDWHSHEMLFGYLPAIVTGFLLTAIPNWTGRLPVQGSPLLLLLLLWVAGRFAVFFSGSIGWLAVAAIDNAFLTAVVAAAAAEIIAGRNWRNLKVLLPLIALLLANVLFDVEIGLAGSPDLSPRLALAAAVMLIVIIGGRIIPSFTHNWLVRENPGRLPQPFGRFDVALIASTALALAAWVFRPDWPGTGAASLFAALGNAIRLARWAGDRTVRDPLVLVLHLAFAFVPVGFAIIGLAALLPELIPAVAGVHAFGVGAIGSMTLAVMVRATLGHTGHPLRAGPATCLIFAAVMLSALLRVLAAFYPGSIILLHGSALFWCIAFLGYALVFGGMLLKPRMRTQQTDGGRS